MHIRMKNRKFVINATNLYKIVYNAYLLPNALNALINIVYKQEALNKVAFNVLFVIILGFFSFHFNIIS